MSYDLRLTIVDQILRRFYNRVVRRKSQEIDQSQSTILFTFDCDWSISCDLRLTELDRFYKVVSRKRKKWTNHRLNSVKRICAHFVTVYVT